MMLLRIVVATSAPALLAAGAFEDTVLPILRQHCLPCHSLSNKTSGLSVMTTLSLLAGGNRRGPAVIAGSPEQSPLVQALRGSIKPQMPPGKTLPPGEMAAIEAWVRDTRAPAGIQQASRHWSLVKPVRLPVPAVRNSAWRRNAIDSFVLARLEASGLQPSGEASPATLVRRLYLDLLGLPPSPEEIREFEENNSPGAYEELVDRLLSNPHYGERWGRYWLDLARYADTNGYEGDPEFYHAWRYRDYVVDSFNADKPYDEFLIDVG